VHNVQQLHDGGTVVGDGDLALVEQEMQEEGCKCECVHEHAHRILNVLAGQLPDKEKDPRDALLAALQQTPHLVIMDQLIHSARAQSSGHGIDDRHAGIDIADELRLALARVGALFQQDHLHIPEAHKQSSSTTVEDGQTPSGKSRAGGERGKEGREMTDRFRVSSTPPVEHSWHYCAPSSPSEQPFALTWGCKPMPGIIVAVDA